MTKTNRSLIYPQGIQYDTCNRKPLKESHSLQCKCHQKYWRSQERCKWESDILVLINQSISGDFEGWHSDQRTVSFSVCRWTFRRNAEKKNNHITNRFRAVYVLAFCRFKQKAPPCIRIIANGHSPVAACFAFYQSQDNHAQHGLQAWVSKASSGEQNDSVSVH